MEDLTGVLLENWMELLRPHIESRRLVDLRMPGSHDANSYSFTRTGYADPFGRCQFISIAGQLKIGVRYLDIRYGPDPKDEKAVLDQHGIVKGGSVWNHFIEIRDFCRDHPMEFVIINFQNEAKISQKAKTLALRRLAGTLGGLLVSQEDCDTWFRLDKVTLGEIWASKKRVLLLSHPHLTEDCELTPEEMRKTGVLPVSEFQLSQWHDVNNVDELLERNSEWLSKRPTDRLFVSQFVLTAERDITSIVKNVFVFKLPTILNFVERLYKRSLLSKFIAENVHRNFNVLLFDYINFDMNIVCLIIGSNIDSKLTLYSAHVGSIDCTNQLRRHVTQTGALFVPSIQKFCKFWKFPLSQLTVVYSFSDSPLMVLQSSPELRSFFIYDNPLNAEKVASMGVISLLLFYASHVKHKVLLGADSMSEAKTLREKGKEGLLFGVVVRGKQMVIF